MAITPYRTSTDVFRPMMEEFFGPLRGHGGRMTDLMRMPDSDVVETETEIRVMTEMPGMKSEDIEVDLENNVLTIRGEKREERNQNDEKNTWHLSERRYGQFTRSFVLPRDVEGDRIEARFEDGVLHVRVPKSEKARRRRIEVSDGGGQRSVETNTGGNGQGGREVGSDGNS